MHILMLVGKFPDLTFIFRTATGLVARGHQVTVAARKRGDWRPYQAYLPLPAGFTVQYLLPDDGFSNPRLTLHLLTKLPLLMARSPIAALKLLKRCWNQHESIRDTFVNFVRYLPFIHLHAGVIHFDFPMTANIYRLLPELLHAPTVVSCRGSDIHLLQHRNSAEQAGRLQVLCSATALHCVSDEMATAVTHLSGRSTNVWINRPAVPVHEILPKSQYETSTIPQIIWVGRLDWIKGLDYLLASLAQLKRSGSLFKTQLIGDGELRSVLRFSIEDLDLASEVELIGRLPAHQVIERLREADLFVLSSHDEGISNAVLEAMAVGLPVVTTSAGGMAEAVRDGIDGFVVPVRDINALADRINCLLIDPDLRRQMGQAARAHVEAEFSLERQAAVFEQMYQSIISNLDLRPDSAN